MARRQEPIRIRGQEFKIGPFQGRVKDFELYSISADIFPSTFAALLTLDEAQKLFPGPWLQVLEHLPAPDKAEIRNLLERMLSAVIGVVLADEEEVESER